MRNSARLQAAPVTAEDFREWREHPVTEWVLAALSAQATRQQAAWVQASWVQGASDPMLLTELRTRADAYEAIAQTDYLSICERLDQTPTTGE